MSGLGTCTKIKAKFDVKENITRTVKYSSLEPINKALEGLETLTVLSKVDSILNGNHQQFT